MALPFIAGVAVGVGVVIAFTKNKTLKEKSKEVFIKSKKFVSLKLEKSKNIASDVKHTINATKECIKEKKECIKEDAIKEIKEEKECKKA